MNSTNERNYVAKIVLTAFFGAEVKEVENENGDLEKCVCIPIDRNNLKIGRTGKVSAYAFVNPCLNANTIGWSHYMVMKSANAFVDKIKGLGYRMPYLGNMKPSNYIMYSKNYKESFVRVNKDE